MSNEQSTTDPTLDAAQLEVELGRVRQQLQLALKTIAEIELDIATMTPRDTLLRWLAERRALITQAGKP
ncbi:hypothetical protein CMK11_17805 [Candidatus Poribacteria bacterium]|nr:hypothetical protein [Candidatus Poribacteria bacterium]